MQGLYSDSEELSRRTCGYLTRYRSIYAIQELTGVGESRKNAVLKLDERGSDHSYRFISIPAPEPLGNVDRFAARRHEVLPTRISRNAPYYYEMTNRPVGRSAVTGSNPQQKKHPDEA
jgi:hypothetical protein